MSNTKSVRIEGTIPFNTYEYPELNSKLGELNAPSFGLRIRYEDCSHVPNEHGGKTTMYGFRIEGEEAVPLPWIGRLAEAILEAKGTLTRATILDVDNRMGLLNSDGPATAERVVRHFGGSCPPVEA